MQQYLRKQTIKRWLRLFSWIALITNAYPVGNIILLFGNEFDYVTKQGRWTYEDQFFGQRYEDVYASYQVNSQEPGYEDDSPLYRTSPINVLKFWRWSDYTIHPRWRLPYNDQTDTLKKGPVKVNPEKLRLWKRMQDINGY
ncbi:hypothetical protein [Fibrivirga algicola]|uniref:Uncharacterized protein n=1 Tax=Fibrivirga algicola TaxID=2950420 RepID=A0ABX0QJY1_9BACT|nr:hypothetical protein [Fibrivirga algicola]ARK11386.1 hypothetical protein A6C57_14250 [Fibrella sp. ES10-3-2-2]NID12759.1 hypothetical protein [Fibrivirga algicola]